MPGQRPASLQPWRRRNRLTGYGTRSNEKLAAALALYRRRLEREGGFVRLQPDHALDWLKDIEVQEGPRWLKLIDTQGKQKHKAARSGAAIFRPQRTGRSRKNS